MRLFQCGKRAVAWRRVDVANWRGNRGNRGNRGKYWRKGDDVDRVRRMLIWLWCVWPIGLAGLAGLAGLSGLTGLPAVAAASVPLVNSPLVNSPLANSALRADFAFAEPYFADLGQIKSPDPTITALLQDREGWLWIGTQSGLYRYDGHRMRKFAHDAANSASLAGNFVTALWQAADGRLWVGTHSDGVSIFDPQREQFTHLQHDPASAGSVAGGRVWAMLGDGAGGVWIGTEHGLDWCATDGTTLRYYRKQANDPASLVDNRIRSLLLDKQRVLWVGSVGGLQRYQTLPPLPSVQAGQAGPVSAQVPRFVPRLVPLPAGPDRPVLLAGHEVRVLLQAQDGKLWLGTRKAGAAWLDPAQARPEPHWLAVDPARADRLSHGWVTTILEAQPGQIWLGTEGGGLNIVAAQDGTVLQRLQHDPANSSSVAHDSIWILLADRSGMIWLGTWGGGLQRHHPAQQAFRVLRHRSIRAPGLVSANLSHPEMRSMLELPDGRILLGTGGNGIDILDRQRGMVGAYRVKSGQPGQPGSLPDGRIMALAQTPDGTLWAGTQQNGVVRLAPGSSEWQDSSAGLPAPQVRKFLLARDGSLWVGTVSGIARWQADAQRFVAQQQFDGSALQVSVFAMDEDRQGRLWAASASGLWVKNSPASGWQAIRQQRGRADALPSDIVLGLLVDRDNRLWVSTGKGLVRLQSWDGRNAQFEPVGAKAGQPGRFVGGNMWQDRSGQIWFGSDTLWQLDPHRLHLSEHAGPDLGSVWTGAYGATRDGLLVFGGTRGMTIFNPARFAALDYQPMIKISELKINGLPVPPATWQPRLRLLPGQRQFSVEFAALDFSQSGPQRYRYRLLKEDADWIAADGEHRLASYGNLWPGHYTLQVQGSNSQGVWSRKLLHLPVAVVPAFWQTGPFVALALLLLGGSIWGGYHWRLARVQALAEARARALQREVAQRTAEALAAHRAAEQAQHATLAAQNELALARQLEQTREKMLQQEKMAALGTLTAGVAHEINNPTNYAHVAGQNLATDLQAFEQFLMALLDDDPNPELVQAFGQRFAQLHQHVGTLLNGTERIQTIVKDLRTFSRREVEQKRTLPLSECLLSTLNLVRPNWLGQVEFITEFSDDPPCTCWPTLLNQVFMNLLVNSCHAIAERQRQEGATGVVGQVGAVGAVGAGQMGQMSAPGHVWLRLYRCQREGQHWLVAEVKDDGCGMPDAVRERILEPFFTTKDADTGTGLGLSIAHGIIQKHGGMLEISSTEGQGSCFATYLPLDLQLDLPLDLPLDSPLNSPLDLPADLTHNSLPDLPQGQ